MLIDINKGEAYMNCPNCQTINIEGAKFCFNCGTPLSIACTNCGTQLVAGAKFCFNCGQAVSGAAPASSPPIQAAPAVVTPPLPTQADTTLDKLQQYIPRELLNKLEAARVNRSMAGERRIVTVLFCDIKGSTSLAELLDPEEWAEVMNGTFNYLIEPIYRYEGTLARLMGDAILAFFGAPIAHEDDPQRAVLAGLDIISGMREYSAKIKRERGFDLNVRVGINTGLVVVGEVGSDLRVEYTAMGDAVNLASRMEQTANPNTVRISGNTYKTVSNLFNFNSLGEIEVRGKEEPVATYEVLGVREGAVPTRGIEGLASPLVGRARELATLKEAVQSVTGGRGHVVSLMGEAGLGKSRLIAELQKWTAANSPALQWYEGRSLSYETSIPYAPFIDMLGGIFAFRATDSDAERYEKVTAGIEQIMPGQSDDIAPFLATLLGIKLEDEPRERVRYLEPPFLRGRTFMSVARLVAGLASQGPLVLLFEDLHWVDPTSLELVESLLPLTQSAPLLLLAIFRPNEQEPSWHFHELASGDYINSYTPVLLQPLDESESRQLVANLLEIEDLPESVRALILRKAEGNPFFVEEVIRSLLDAKLVVREDDHWRATREIENIAVPDTLAGVIIARLDRLDDEAKYVAQAAAVVGREFQYDVLSEVYEAPRALDPSLATLQQRELVREKSGEPNRSYLFKHVLTQETAYASLLLSRRRELHRRVAACLERVEPERVNDIARHYLEARQEELALPYLVESARRAAGTGARDEAISQYRRALDIARHLDRHDFIRQVYEGLGKTLEFAMQPGEAIKTFEDMLAFGEEHSDVPMQISALNKMSYTLAFVLGQLPEAGELLSRAEVLARSHEQAAGLAEAITVRCAICTFTADFDSAEKHLAEAADLGRQIEDPDTTAFGLAHRANMLTHLAQFDEAYKVAQEGLIVASEARNQERRADLMGYSIPYYHLHRGELAEASRWAEDAYKTATRIGALIPAVLSTNVLGFVAEMWGDYEAALDWHMKGLQISRPATDFLPFLTVLPLSGLGTVCLEISESLKDKVLEYHLEAENLLKTPGGSISGGAGWADLGFCALALGYPEMAYERFQSGLSSPSIPMFLQRPRLLAGAALAASALGKVEEARSLIDEAHRYSEERGFKHFYPLISLIDAQVSKAQGDTRRALAQFKRAETLAHEMGMRHITWQADLGASQLLRECGNLSEADVALSDAREILNELAATFQDDSYRLAFEESAAGRVS